MKKIGGDRVGLVIAFSGLIGALCGFAIALLWSDSVGVPLIQISIIVAILGVVVNYWVMFRKKKNHHE